MKNLIGITLCLLGLCCMTQQSIATDTETLSSRIRALTGRDPSNYQSQTPQDVEGRALESQKASALKQIPLTVEYAAKLFFLSFRFSQGETKAQKHIFDYLRTLHPDWVLTDEFKGRLADKAGEHVERWFAQPELPHTKSLFQSGLPEIKSFEIKFIVDEQVLAFQGAFQDKPTNQEVVIELIAKDIIDRDYTYLAARRGRPRPHDQGKVTPLTDPFLSHLCHYGFLGNHTGAEEYNRMFRDVIAYIKESVPKPGSNDLNFHQSVDRQLVENQLIEVIRVHNERHPETPVSLPSQPAATNTHTP